MNTHQKSSARWSLAQKCLGAMLVGIALFAIVAWFNGDHFLQQLHSQYAPLHLNAALGFLAWGFAFFAIRRGWYGIAHIVGAMLIFFAIISFAQNQGALPFEIDQWARSLNPSSLSFPRGGMLPPLTVAFCMAGFMLLLMKEKEAFHGFSIFLALGGATLVTGSLAAFIGSQMSLAPSQAHGPPLLALLGGIFGGLGFLTFALRPTSSHRPVGYSIPLLVGFTGIVFTLVLWQALNDQQGQRIFRQTQFEAVYVNRTLDEKLPIKLQQFAEQSERAFGSEEDQKKNDIGKYMAQRPGYIGVAAVNDLGYVRWIEYVGRHDLPESLTEMGVQELLAAALDEGKTAIVRAPRSCWQGARVLVMYAPYRPDAPEEGGLIGVQKIHELLESILNSNVAAGYAISITDKDELLFGRSMSQTQNQEALRQTLPVNFREQSWNVNVWPTPDLLARESLSLPKFALMVGFLTTTLLALAVYLAQTARWRALDLEREIRERRLAEGALKQSEEKYRLLVDNLEQGIFLKDRGGKYVAVNQFFCQSIGRLESEVIGKTNADLFEPSESVRRSEEERIVLDELQKAENEYERVINGKKNVIRRILTPVKGLSGTPAGVLGICWDVTEQRLLETRLRQAGKMDAIGQLAGGIAHDFNNLLTAILGNLDLMLSGVKPGERQYELVTAAQNAATRAAALTNRLLGFSRQHQINWEPTNINTVVQEVVTLLGRTIDPRVRLEPRTAPDLWLVQADSGQINQVIMNLCLNARDAIKSVGKITIDTECVEITNLDGQLSADARTGSFVRLRIGDTGSGMTTEVRARIFEPFFTTKEVGKGTGLGLAMVFAIVRQHQGWIECQSSVDHGTQFDVYLPKTNQSMKQTPIDMPTPLPTRLGNETILIADDEPMIRRLATLVLQRGGYTVLEAEDGQQAVDLYEREQDHIDLVLLDLTMPVLSGQEAFRKMLQINPSVKVLFASGYAVEQITIDEQEKVFGFVKKPYRAAELIQTIQEALRRQVPERLELVGCAEMSS
ncbi:MAG: response regulator [Planctomycetes bacterium]|nr:response regulator [Planctomycetota bacterium]